MKQVLLLLLVNFNPIIVLFLTTPEGDFGYDEVSFQSYYSLIFNLKSHMILLFQL